MRFFDRVDAARFVREMIRTTFIFCGSYQEFAYFCREDLGMSPKKAEKNGVRWLRDEFSIYGAGKINIIAYGQPFTHPKAAAIIEEIRMAKNSGRLA